MARPGAVGSGLARYGKDIQIHFPLWEMWRGTAWRGEAWLGSARLGEARIFYSDYKVYSDYTVMLGKEGSGLVR